MSKLPAIAVSSMIFRDGSFSQRNDRYHTKRITKFWPYDKINFLLRMSLTAQVRFYR